MTRPRNQKLDAAIARAYEALQAEGQPFSMSEVRAKYGFSNTALQNRPEWANKLKELQTALGAKPPGRQRRDRPDPESIDAAIARAYKARQEEGKVFTFAQTYKDFGFSSADLYARPEWHRKITELLLELRIARDLQRYEERQARRWARLAKRGQQC